MSVALLPMLEFYIDDDRYGVPTLRLIPVEDVAEASAVAQQILAESGHHRGVEVCHGGERVLGIGSFATRRAAPEQGLGADA